MRSFYRKEAYYAPFHVFQNLYIQELPTTIVHNDRLGGFGDLSYHTHSYIELNI